MGGVREGGPEISECRKGMVGVGGEGVEGVGD